jgi:hypothetical protein
MNARFLTGNGQIGSIMTFTVNRKSGSSDDLHDMSVCTASPEIFAMLSVGTDADPEFFLPLFIGLFDDGVREVGPDLNEANHILASSITVLETAKTV